MDRKTLKGLVERLHSRYPVTIRIERTMEDHGEVTLVLAAFMEQEGKLSQMLDQFATTCEDIGIGRVEDEECLLDDIDNILDAASE